MASKVFGRPRLQASAGAFGRVTWSDSLLLTKAVPVRRPYQSKGLTSPKVLPVRRPYQYEGLTSTKAVPVEGCTGTYYMGLMP
jgi:hypothetical protein